jgi:hypothetical protein
MRFILSPSRVCNWLGFVLCLSTGTAFCQVSNCPQPTYYDTITCSYTKPKCSGTTALYYCDDTNLTSPDECVTVTPNCCNKPVYYTLDTNYGSDCGSGGCSVAPRKGTAATDSPASHHSVKATTSNSKTPKTLGSPSPSSALPTLNKSIHAPTSSTQYAKVQRLPKTNTTKDGD